MKLTTHLHPPPRLRISGFTAQFPPAPSCYKKGQLSLSALRLVKQQHALRDVVAQRVLSRKSTNFNTDLAIPSIDTNLAPILELFTEVHTASKNTEDGV
jgi:hypothetical protein